MTRATGRIEPTGADRRGRWKIGVTAVALALLLAGCNAVSGMFEDEEEPSRVAVPAEAQGDQPFPNLGTVPDEPPETSTPEERAQIREGLAADRDNAEYTDESLGAQSSTAAPAAPPAPAEAPQQAAAGSGESEAADAAPANPAPPPPPSPVASPSIESQPVPPPATASAPQPAPTPSQAAAAQPPAPQPVPAPQPAPPPVSAPQPQVLEGGSVIVNPDAATAAGGRGVNPLLPSGESRPVALIFFGHGSASLSRSDVKVLREVAELHKERGGLVRVIGHASMSGATGGNAKQNLANFNISLARANSVARELSRLGVATDQIQVAAAGAQQPMYYETAPTGEAGNRRVEIYLDY